MSRRGGGNNNNLNSSVVYLGQVPYDWDVATVKSVVCGSGNVVDVRLGFDYAGKNKGFCFVEYLNPSEAQRALPFLTQIKLFNQSNKGQFKKLKVELSKEGFLKSNSPSEAKTVLHLDRNNLPSYVQLPQDMLGGIPPQQNPLGYSRSSNSPAPQNIYSPRTNQSQIQGQGQGQPQSQIQSQLQSKPNAGPLPQIPAKILSATKHLPQPQQLPFDKSSDINQVLSKVPPAQLIELIATLKNILNSGDENKAFEILNYGPDISSAVAQALLLMGFIDNDVISSAKDAPARPPQNQPIQPQQQYQAPSLQSFIPPPPPPPQQQQQQQPIMNNQYNNGPPNLSIDAQAKLMSDQMPIAQVLALSQDQIDKLGPQEKELLNYLRSQYKT
ncbi:hypothetical protein DFJ63DRAFT_320282 [Scheffersomyces coipomensis]|uniref:uncharacterized protein n=1 Tax=Scheffersomyces coipomensis TaxID=1788519 RepID=UPI00315C6219